MADAPAPDAERTLLGHVEDADGRPIAAAEVGFEGSPESARTGPDGRFSLRAPFPDAACLVVREGGRVSRVPLSSAHGERVRVVAVPPDAVALRVLTPGSAPVPRRFGWLALLEGDAGLCAGPSGEAQSPRFAVRGLPAGTHALLVWAGPFLPAVADPVVLDGRTSHALVSVELMRRGASVAGRVLASGAPRAGATVTARAEDAAVRLPPGRSACESDAGGRYRLEGLPPGRYVLTVETGTGLPAETTLSLLPREERALDLVS